MTTKEKVEITQWMVEQEARMEAIEEKIDGMLDIIEGMLETMKELDDQYGSD